MRHLFLGAVGVCAVIGQASAQLFYPGSPPPQSDPNLSAWRAVAPTPDDAYREGFINRWQLEQLQGRQPQALEGPSPNGVRGDPGE